MLDFISDFLVNLSKSLLYFVLSIILIRCCGVFNIKRKLKRRSMHVDVCKCKRETVKWREKFNNWLETSNIGETQRMYECDKRHAWPWFDNKNLESGYWCKFITSSIVVFITSDFHIFPSIGKKKQIQSNNSSSEILVIFFEFFY